MVKLENIITLYKWLLFVKYSIVMKNYNSKAYKKFMKIDLEIYRSKKNITFCEEFFRRSRWLVNYERELFKLKKIFWNLSHRKLAQFYASNWFSIKQRHWQRLMRVSPVIFFKLKEKKMSFIKKNYYFMKKQNQKSGKKLWFPNHYHRYLKRQILKKKKEGIFSRKNYKLFKKEKKNYTNGVFKKFRAARNYKLLSKLLLTKKIFGNVFFFPFKLIFFYNYKNNFFYSFYLNWLFYFKINKNKIKKKKIFVFF